jgi:hypothetical protein
MPHATALRQIIVVRGSSRRNPSLSNQPVGRSEFDYVNGCGMIQMRFTAGLQYINVPNVGTVRLLSRILKFVELLTHLPLK